MLELLGRDPKYRTSSFRRDRARTARSNLPQRPGAQLRLLLLPHRGAGFEAVLRPRRATPTANACQRRRHPIPEAAGRREPRGGTRCCPSQSSLQPARHTRCRRSRTRCRSAGQGGASSEPDLPACNGRRRDSRLRIRRSYLPWRRSENLLRDIAGLGCLSRVRRCPIWNRGRDILGLRLWFHRGSPPAPAAGLRRQTPLTRP